MKKRLFLPILAIFIVAICLSSVSAVEANHFNSTVKTVDDNSQFGENIVIDEIDTANNDYSNSIDEPTFIGSENNSTNEKVMTNDDVGDVAFEQKDHPTDNIKTPERKFTKDVFIFADTNKGMENSVVKINLHVIDGNHTPISEGIVKIYSDYAKTKLIGAVNLFKGETSFEYNVPECPEPYRSKEINIWYEYEKYDAENNILYYTNDNSIFNTIKTNNLNIVLDKKFFS